MCSTKNTSEGGSRSRSDWRKGVVHLESSLLLSFYHSLCLCLSQLLLKLPTNLFSSLKDILFTQFIANIDTKFVILQSMSKQIDLITSEQAKELKNHSHLEQHRPDKLAINTPHILNPKWSQCKVLGKNILIRSYAGACVNGKDLYVYGGLQILKGVLADFNKINLSEDASKYQWVQVPIKDSAVTPGPRAKHALVCHNNKIYLIAGIKSTVQTSNQIHCYDIAEQKWNQIIPKGQPIPTVDSFGCALVGSHIILLCGYNGTTGHFINAVYDYDIENNTFSTLFADTDSKTGKAPVARANCSAATDNKETVYIFGGCHNDVRCNDLWEFNIRTKEYSKVEDKEELRPVVRSGHSLTFYEDKLYLFGGIHEVTWELDDLHIYDIKIRDWTTLEIDSARRKQSSKHVVHQKHTSEAKQQKISPHHKKSDNYWYEANTSHLSHNKSSSPNHPNHPTRSRNIPPLFKEDPLDVSAVSSVSPGKMIEEQKKKEQMQKKAEMLKQFDVPEKDKQRYINIEPSTQAMKNSLDIIGNPIAGSKHPGKLTEFGKETCSKFLQPLTNNVNIIVGRKPCARDGHNTLVMGPSLIIFGGDRHQMSFNDIYRLDMNLVSKQFQS